MKMKISNQYNHSYAKMPHKSVAFNGYIAAPIKELHIPAVFSPKFKPFLNELNQKCGKYFKIVVQTSEELINNLHNLNFTSTGYLENTLSFKWGQDNKIFLGNDKFGIFHKSLSTAYVPELAKKLGLQMEHICLNIVGGNCFLGKKPNGENFAIVGKDALDFSNKKDVAEIFDINPKNLNVVSQPNFHIDLAIRPLNYPYVLVGDTKLTIDLAIKSHCDQKQFKYLKHVYKNMSSERYASPDKIIYELRSRGFKTIKVPGLIHGDTRMNFMNAIVHQEENGDLVYITNKNYIKDDIGIDFESIFEKYLRSKAPAIKEVHFIDGDGFIRSSLNNGGGIHCLSAERVDNEKWAEILNKN